MVLGISSLEENILKVLLNPAVRAYQAQSFEQQLSNMVIGQDRAVRRLTELYQVFLSGLNAPNKPIGTLLFLGNSGSGKSYISECAAKILFNNPLASFKIDCAEYQQSHDIAKLIGAVAGYLGHKDTPPILSQENLDKYHTQLNPLTFLVFDEIEKANESLWQLLLGILDKAILTLGDTRRTDFSKCIIMLTSNLGSREISNLVTNNMGFAPMQSKIAKPNELDQKIYQTARDAAKKRFSPEFINRLDKIVVFRSLKSSDYIKILDLEINKVQDRIIQNCSEKFLITLSEKAKQFLLKKGIDVKYGARHLKRAIDKYIVNPLSNLISSGQLSTGDLIDIDIDNSGKLIFFGTNGGALIGKYHDEYINAIEKSMEKSIANFSME